MKDLFFLCSFAITVTAGMIEQSKTVDFTSSNLPIIIIDTKGQTIPDDSRIVAEMDIIWNENGQRNYLSDPANNYAGRIEIELHGQSSLIFPKKSYRIETQDSLGDNLNVSLLGMPKENDWILYAPYSDKTLMRNVLSYTLAGEINDYAPRVQFCELVLNHQYHGIYVLTERIKRDRNRVDISELLPLDLTEPEISGGYIFKKDKTDAGDNIIRLERGLELIIIEPKNDEIIPAQTSWLKTHLNTFDKALFSSANYADYIDMQSFVDNFLIVELTKNIDGFRLSTYFYKDRNDKIVAGPVWDYNFSLGNADYNDGWTPVGWYYSHITWDNNWWLELIKKPAFQDLCIERWKGLRQNVLTTGHIFEMIDEWSALLEEAQQRNFELYPILGTYIWPNPGYPESGSYGYNSPTSGAPTTWAGEIAFMKDFIQGRLQWMDEEFGLQFVDLSTEVEQRGWGHILYNNRIIADETYLGTFPNDKSVTFLAESQPGYEFVEWQEINRGQRTSTWINTGAQWKYLDNGSDQGVAWYSDSFDDSNWKEGAAELGYGDNDEATVVSYGPDSQNKYVTTYFRNKFNVVQAVSYDHLTINLLRDDGALMYLNGIEVARSNMPETAINYNTFALEFVDGSAEKTFHTFLINPQHLREGQNILAVEIHQQNRSSSDISFNLRLQGSGVNQEGDTTVIGTAEKLTYLPTANSTIRAVFKPLSGFASRLVINEIHYNSPQGEPYEFIELYNNSDSTLNLSGFSFEQGIDFSFPTGTIVDPQKFIVLCSDSTAYNLLDCQVFQWTAGALLNDGQRLILADSTGNLTDSVAYSNAVPWPEAANGGGFSLELKNPSADNSLAKNWQRSYRMGGSPGQPTVRIINKLFINEFLTSNQNTNQDEYVESDDWIELYNGGDEAIDIGGLYLSDKKDTPNLWQIPVISPHSTTLEPDSFMLLWADGDPAQGILHLSFQLNKSGESINLAQIVNNETFLIDTITYPEQSSDVSMGRLPDGGDNWYLFKTPSPGTENILTAMAEVTPPAVRSFSLTQNYPNPFNPATTIRYTVGTKHDNPIYVNLSIYNLLGQKVVTLVSENQQAGEYTVRFDASGLGSGIYFYRLQAGKDFMQTKKLVLLR